MNPRQRMYLILLIDIEDLYRMAQDTTAGVMLSGRADRLLAMFTFSEDIDVDDCREGFAEIEDRFDLHDVDWLVHEGPGNG